VASCAILEALARWLVDAKNVIDIREFESLGFCARGLLSRDLECY
jgi:hypothetical protein